MASLWLQGCVPAATGMYGADGTARVVEVDGASLSFFRLGAQFDLRSLVASDPTEVAEVDESTRMELLRGLGYVCCGEGAHGSEGYFARIDQSDNLVWVVFMRNSNPFERIEFSGSKVKIINNLGNFVLLDLADPVFF
jgi:hypothetical protein